MSPYRNLLFTTVFWHLFLLVSLSVCYSSALAQDDHYQAEGGTPYMSYYSPKQYRAHQQNWQMVQDQRGMLYVANTEGVLEYDGFEWRSIPTAEKSVVRSLAVNDLGRIYVGAQNEIGYLAADSTGALFFSSLEAYLGPNRPNFGEVWKTYAKGDYIYFITRDIMFEWHEASASMNVIEFPSPLDKQYGFLVNDELYLLMQGRGLVNYKDNAFNTVPGGEVFMGDRIYTMTAFTDSSILIGTRKEGLFICKEDRCSRLGTDTDKYLEENQLYHGTALPDGTYALATLTGGIVIIDGEGYILRTINLEDFLPNPQVYYLFVDNQKGLWVALNNGLARFEINAALQQYPKSAAIGTIYDIERHKGTLYLASSQGVYYLKSGKKEVASSRYSPSSFVPVTGFFTEAYDLKSEGDLLMVATAGAIYTLNDKLNPSIVYNGGAKALYQLPDNKNIVYAGLDDGFAQLQFNAHTNRWEKVGKSITQLQESITYLAYSERTNALWAASQHDGIFILPLLDNGSVDSTNIKKYTTEHGLLSNRNTKVFTYHNEPLILSDKKLLVFNSATNTFVQDKRFKKIAHLDIISLQPDSLGNIFIHSENGNGTAILNSKGNFEWQPVPLSRITNAEINTIYPEANGMIWLGGLDGLIRYNSNLNIKYKRHYPSIIRSITAGNDDTKIFSGTNCDENNCAALIENGDLKELNYKHNTIKFTYTALSYVNEAANTYQYILEGFNQRWSDWTTENKREYLNLSPGEYRFRVRAKNAYGFISEEDSFAFTIRQPWFSQWWAYIIYALAAVGIVSILLYLRTRNLIAQRTRLRENVRSRTAELNNSLKELQSTQNQLIVQEKLASLGQLTAGIAHEIQNPLNFILNFAVLSNELMEELKDELTATNTSTPNEEVEEIIHELDENVDKIVTHGNRIDSIIKNMLLHSRADGGGFKKVPINKLISEYLQLAYHGFRAKYKGFNVSIAQNLDPEIKDIEVVQQDIGRALLNIINNALYALREKQLQLAEQNETDFQPQLQVATTTRGNNIRISIKDNGPGIPKVSREKIFEPFYTTKPTGEGTGLGLSLSYDIIVGTHKGDIQINTKKNKFTEFIIDLPKQQLKITKTTGNKK